MTDRLRLPTLTTAQLQEVDRRMVKEYSISLLQMMENAGRSLAMLARRILGGEVTERPVVVLAGRGNNGGGALAAARHLQNWGAWIHLICAYPPEKYGGAPGQQLATLQAMGVALSWAEEGWELPPADLLVDGIIGDGLRGDPRGKARHLIQLANSSRAPILSLETPSGVDTDKGRCFNPHVRSAATLTLALPKAGFLHPEACAACGELYLADISVPSALWGQIGIEVPPQLFARDDIQSLHVSNGECFVEV